MANLLHVVRVPSLGLPHITDAAYYGYAYAIHIGPWLVFCFPVRPHA